MTVGTAAAFIDAASYASCCQASSGAVATLVVAASMSFVMPVMRVMAGGNRRPFGRRTSWARTDGASQLDRQRLQASSMSCPRGAAAVAWQSTMSTSRSASGQSGTGIWRSPDYHIRFLFSVIFARRFEPCPELNRRVVYSAVRLASEARSTRSRRNWRGSFFSRSIAFSNVRLRSRTIRSTLIVRVVVPALPA